MRPVIATAVIKALMCRYHIPAEEVAELTASAEVAFPARAPAPVGQRIERAREYLARLEREEGEERPARAAQAALNL